MTSEERRIKMRKYYADNPDKFKGYYQKNRDKILKYYKDRYEPHPRTVKGRQKVNREQYERIRDSRNTPERREYQRLYYAEHKDEIKARRILG